MDVERGITQSQFAILNVEAKASSVSSDSEDSDQSPKKTEDKTVLPTSSANNGEEGYTLARDLEMEYRILMRINCHKAQFNQLYKNSSSEFRRKNKYNEILPFLHNMVKI